MKTLEEYNQLKSQKEEQIRNLQREVYEIEKGILRDYTVKDRVHLVGSIYKLTNGDITATWDEYVVLKKYYANTDMFVGVFISCREDQKSISERVIYPAMLTHYTHASVFEYNHAYDEVMKVLSI